MKIFSVNATTEIVQHKTIGGINYMIVPTVMAIEGVMNDIYYPADVLSTNLDSWQGVPVPLGNHPQANGVHISAKTPAIWATNPATLWNPKVKDNKLKGEIWIDTNQAKALGGSTAETVGKLEAGETLEVSTGLFPDLIEEAGEFNGKTYSAKATAISGDHLAILIDEPGACSVQDGCGVPRINSEEQMERTYTVNIDLALVEQDTKVWNAWYDQAIGKGSILKITANEVVTTAPGVFYIIPYTITEAGDVEFSNAMEADIVPVSNEPMTTNSLLEKLSQTIANAIGYTKGGIVNTKDEIVERLVANERCQLSEAGLNALSEDDLKVIEDSFSQPVQPEPSPVEEPATNSKLVTPPAPSPVSEPPEWATKLIGKVEALEGKIQANIDQERSQLIAEIVTNQETFDEATLKGFDTDNLRRIRQLTVPADYAGRGLPNPHTNSGDWEDYEAPEVQTNGAGGTQ